MTPGQKHFITITGVIIGVLGLGGALAVVPPWREAKRLRAETVELDRSVQDLTERTLRFASLRERIDDRRSAMRHELREILSQPDHAQLIRALSLPIDGARVADQTFTRGRETLAVPGAPEYGSVVPLTIDVKATFDAVFSLVREADSLPRLVRVAAVRMRCQRTEDADEPLVTATVAIEAVFDGTPETGS